MAHKTPFFLWNDGEASGRSDPIPPLSPRLNRLYLTSYMRNRLLTLREVAV